MSGNTKEFLRWQKVHARSEAMDDGRHGKRLKAMHEKVGEWSHNKQPIHERYLACAIALEEILEPPVDLSAMAADEYEEVMAAQQAMEGIGS